MEFQMLLLQMVSVMMKPTIQIVTMMVVTVVEHAYWQIIVQIVNV